MSTEETLEKKIEMPSLKVMFDEESVKGIEYHVEVAEFLENLKVPTVKDGSADVGQLINQLLTGVKPIVGKYFKNSEDPTWTPDYEGLQSIFKNYKNIVGKDGKLRREVREQLIAQYSPQNNVIARGQGRVARNPLDPAKDYGIDIATEHSHKEVVPLIKGSVTPNDVARYVTPVMTEAYTKRQSGYGLHGNFEYLKTPQSQLDKAA